MSRSQKKLMLGTAALVSAIGVAFAMAVLLNASAGAGSQVTTTRPERFSAYGKLHVFLSRDHEIFVKTLGQDADLQRIFSSKDRRIVSLCFDAYHRSLLAVLAEPNDMCSIDIVAGGHQREIYRDEHLRWAAVSPDGQVIAVLRDIPRSSGFALLLVEWQSGRATLCGFRVYSEMDAAISWISATRFVFADEDGRICIASLPSGEVAWTGKYGFGPIIIDGPKMLFGRGDSYLYECGLEGQDPIPLRSATGITGMLVASADNRYIISLGSRVHKALIGETATPAMWVYDTREQRETFVNRFYSDAGGYCAPHAVACYYGDIGDLVLHP